MDYPTREMVEFAMRQPDTLMYEKDSLEGVVFVAQQNMLKKIGGVLLAMHDALDAKQAELDGRTEALDWTADRCDELALEAGLAKIELAKAHDLIRRMVPFVKGVMVCVTVLQKWNRR